MAPSHSAELAETLLQTELLSRAQIAELTERLATLPDDPNELICALVQRNLLTSYQAEQVLAGKAKSLVLGPYVLLEPIGVGGMGEVFQARQKRLNRTVAVKLLRPDLVNANPGAVKRFRREAHAVAKLSHPNVVQIIDFDQDEGTYFIVMEHVNGPNLEQLVQDVGPLPVPLACDYVRQAALGLQHVQAAGLIHRDVKPSNLLIAHPEAAKAAAFRDALQGGTAWVARGGSFAQGLVKILDMGLARVDVDPGKNMSLTQEGAMMGTPDYIAPEQAKDAKSADIRADIYSLGCTFYFLLTGRPPFPDGNTVEKLLQHQLDAPIAIEQLRADVPPEVRAVVARMMEKKPERRFQMPIDAAEALGEILGIPDVPSAGKAEMLALAEQHRSGGSTGGRSTPDPAAGVRTFVAAPTDTPRPPETAPAVTIVTAQAVNDRENRSAEVSPDRPVETAKKMTVLRGHSGPVMALTFSPDCRMLASAGLDSRIQVWILGPTPRELGSLADARLGEIQILAFTPDGEALVNGSAAVNSRMILWPWRQCNGQVLEAAPPICNALAFSPDGQTLASATAAFIWLWEMDNPPRKKTVLRNVAGDVKALQFSPDGKQLVSGDAAGSISFWKLGGWSGGRSGSSWDGHAEGVCCLAYSADGSLLASAGLDRAVRIWDGSGANGNAKATLPNHRGPPRQLMFLPETRFLLAATESGQVILWDWPKGERAHEWRLEQSLCCSLALARDGSLVASGGSDGSVCVFDLVPE